MFCCFDCVFVLLVELLFVLLLVVLFVLLHVVLCFGCVIEFVVACLCSCVCVVGRSMWVGVHVRLVCMRMFCAPSGIGSGCI